MRSAPLRSIIERPPVVLVGLLILVLLGLVVSPFPGRYLGLPRDPIPVDALPNIGENQQIVFAEWPGRSPRDVEDQVTYPLTTALLGAAGVESVRSTSMFGFSMLFVVFDEEMGFHESRARLLEKLASLPPRLLPLEVSPTLGPDATALGQVFWYTLVGQTPEGETTGGWSLHELRTLQDFTVRFALQSVPGVSEVASVGGHVREIQVDVDPDALEAAQVQLSEVAAAVQAVSADAGLRTLEINRVEYLVRSEGTVSSVDQVQTAVVALRDGVPLRVGDLAHVHLGPAQRRGALDDAGAETVGGIVVVRYGENPLEVIRRVKDRIAELQPSLPSKVLPDGQRSRVNIVPFYDRTGLILETLGTLSNALIQQLLVTILVVLVMLRRIGGSLIISALLPLGVMGAFVFMKLFGVEAHIMALSGIAIAIGTMVDMGIVLVENISARLESAGDDVPKAEVVARAAAEVAPAVTTSTLTTVISFLPVFVLSQEEGRMFRPLAFTKTFAVVAALGLAVLVLPTLARFLLPRQLRRPSDAGNGWVQRSLLVGLVVFVGVALARSWLPLDRGAFPGANLLFVGTTLVVLLGGLHLFIGVYPRLLGACLRHGRLFLIAPVMVLCTGLLVWLGAPALFGWLPDFARDTRGMQAMFRAFPGLDEEYMPPFDEGSFLVMPTTMPHASFGESLRLIQLMDARIAEIPEVDRVVGKLGRADTALDPAPISMFETLVTYVPEFVEDEDGDLVRQWRDHIERPEDIWREIEEAVDLPGLTGTPHLQPIETRQVMLQSGMRSPMGLKVQGPSLEVLDALGSKLEAVLREVPSIQAGTVYADRVVGKPYLEVHFDREALARHGMNLGQAQAFLRTAVGGTALARTQNGRERHDIRLRLMAEERNSVPALRRLRIDAPTGKPVPLDAVADLRYRRGPQSIRSEDGFLTSYVVFSGRPGVAESRVVEEARARIEAARQDGTLEVPEGARWRFAGSFEARQRTQRRLALLVPATLLIVFMLLYIQFRSIAVAGMIFSGVAVALSGGFIAVALYGTDWFLSFPGFGPGLRHVLGVEPINLSVAVWVGLIALVGIATDDGVVMATYLDQNFSETPPASDSDRRARIIEAGRRRIRPCLMTTATTVIALLPVVSASGRGADLMRPMAVPILGGMAVELLTLFVVPVLYDRWWALRARRAARSGIGAP